MTHSDWNRSGRSWASNNARPVSALVFLGMVLLGLPAEVRATDERSRPLLSTSPSSRTAKDIETEAMVLRALRKDAQLGPLNLGVHVMGGTAKLSGPVPTAELKQRAIAIVQHVDGVLLVTARDLYVSPSDQGRKRLSVLIQNDPPTKTRAASPPLPSSGIGERPAASVWSISPPPAGAGQPPRNAIALQVPEKAAPPARAGETARLTGNPHPAAPVVSPAAAVENLRQSNVRYQRIRVRVQDAAVYVLPGDSAGEDAMMFAQAVRRLPGVQHVIVSSRSR